MTSKLLLVGAGVLMASLPSAVEAQVFDMGGLTGTLSQDHVTQSERARASRQRSPSSYRSSASYRAQTCANARRMHARGSPDQRLVTLIGHCRRAGY